jgi:hypothetical protein
MRAGVVLAETTSVQLTRVLVLMKYPAESVASSYVKVGDLARSCQRHRQWLERAGVRGVLMGRCPF